MVVHVHICKLCFVVTQETNDSLRQKTAQVMRSKQDDFLPFLTHPETGDSYTPGRESTRSQAEVGLSDSFVTICASLCLTPSLTEDARFNILFSLNIQVSV